MKKFSLVVLLFFFVTSPVLAEPVSGVSNGVVNYSIENSANTESVVGYTAFENAFEWQQHEDVLRNDTFSKSGSFSMVQSTLTTTYDRAFRNRPKTIRVYPNSTYIVGGFSYTIDNGVDSPVDFRRALRVSFLDENLTELQSEDDFADMTVFEEWEKHQTIATSPDNAKYLVLNIESQYGGVEETEIYWDDIFVFGNVKMKWPEWASGFRRLIDDRKAVFQHRKRIDSIGEVEY